MARKLWQKDEIDPAEAELLDRVEAYTVGDDPVVDGHILEDDCWASVAHAAGLVRVGILDEEEFEALRRALVAIVDRHRAEGFPILRSQEDCHTAIEHALVAELGDLGKKIHTGRSRNDQVLTALRLFVRRRLLDVARVLSAFADTLLERAREHERLPMSGYTHTRPAMPMTLGFYWCAQAEALLDDARILRHAHAMNDQCPLGSGAGFGSILPLPRRFTAELLGFSRLQHNALYCQNGRGKLEGVVLHALQAVQDDLAKLAGELIRFSAPAYGFFRLPDAMTTGSSIMPQKRNPDVFELCRARAAVVRGAAAQVSGLGANLPSGYNRDFQLLKRPLVDALAAVEASLAIMDESLRRIEADEEALLASCTREIYGADVAMEEACKGLPFRDAYRKALEILSRREVDDAFRRERIDAYRSPGSMGDPGTAELAAQGEAFHLWIAGQTGTIAAVEERLRAGNLLVG